MRIIFSSPGTFERITYVGAVYTLFSANTPTDKVDGVLELNPMGRR